MTHFSIAGEFFGRFPKIDAVKSFLAFGRMDGSRAWREMRETFEPTYQDGACKEVLHMHYALSMIFGHFLIQKSLNFQF